MTANKRDNIMLKFKLIFLMLFFCLLLLFGQVEKEDSSFNKVWFSYNLGVSGTNAEADNWNSGLYHSLGLNVFGNLNNERSFYGAGININIGSIR